MALVLMGTSPMMRAKENERQQRGWISVVSKYSPQDTIQHLEREARAQGMSVFAKWPLAESAQAADTRAQADDAAQTQVLVLGSEPDLTPVVQVEAGADIQLPLELIVLPRADGTTEVLLKDVAALTRGDEVPPEWAHSVASLTKVVDRALA